MATESKTTAEFAERAQIAAVACVVGDAAAMSTHWIYGDDRVRLVVGDRPEFVENNQKNFRPDGDYFAHKHKVVGDNTHYGEHALLILRSLAENKGAFNSASYANAFKAFFGAGGEYIGYVDSCMKGTLSNMASRESPLAALPAGAFKGGQHTSELSHDAVAPAAMKLYPLLRQYNADNAFPLLERAEAELKNANQPPLIVEYLKAAVEAYLALQKLPTGADDNQMSSLVKLVPLVAARFLNPAKYPASTAEFEHVLETCIRVTQNHDTAVAYNQVAMFILVLVIKGYSPKEAIFAAANRLGVHDSVKKILDSDQQLSQTLGKIKETEYANNDSWTKFPAEVGVNLAKAINLAQDNDDSVAVTGTFGRACYLRMGLPACVHVLLRSQSVEDAIRRSVLSGGDSPARTAYVAAVLSAHLGFGRNGLPAQWLAKTKKASETFSLLAQIQSA